MYTDNRDDEVRLLKDLWSEKATLCPKCKKAELVHLHSKAKKNNCEWKCPDCGEIYRTVRMLKELHNE